MSKQSIRNILLKRMRSLSVAARKQAAVDISIQCKLREDFQLSDAIGVYLTDGFEVDLSLMVQLAWKMDKTCYLPYVFADDNKMLFARYEKNTVLAKNKYNILQPKVDDSYDLVSADMLDLIFMPCVGVDKQHNRLGRGAGYYDQACANITDKTKLIVVAFHCQCVDSVMHVKHDVPADDTILV